MYLLFVIHLFLCAFPITLFAMACSELGKGGGTGSVRVIISTLHLIQKLSGQTECYQFPHINPSWLAAFKVDL